MNAWEQYPRTISKPRQSKKYAHTCNPPRLVTRRTRGLYWACTCGNLWCYGEDGWVNLKKNHNGTVRTKIRRTSRSARYKAATSQVNGARFDAFKNLFWLITSMGALVNFINYADPEALGVVIATMSLLAGALWSLTNFLYDIKKIETYKNKRSNI